MVKATASRSFLSHSYFSRFLTRVYLFGTLSFVCPVNTDLVRREGLDSLRCYDWVILATNLGRADERIHVIVKGHFNRKTVLIQRVAPQECEGKYGGVEFQDAREL